MKILLLSLLAFLAVSCGSNTPTTRIEKNPKIFRALNISQQSLVEVGKIENGMSPAAVFLAWGSPDRQSEGQEDKKRYEQWVYNSLSPVVVQSAWGGWGGGGWGGGGFRRGGLAGPGWGPWGWNQGIGTDVAFVPTPSSWVKFIDGRVESWQQGRKH
jgi:hypothetical protein